jgi:hypothetical protein
MKESTPFYFFDHSFIFWRIDPLLSGDSVNSSVNTLHLLGSKFLTMQQFDYNNGGYTFPTSSVPKYYKRGTRSVVSQYRTGVCEERT